MVSQIDIDKIIPDRELSISGAIIPLGKAKNSMIFWQIAALLEKYEATLKTPVKELPDDAIDEILYGSDERIKIKKLHIGTSSDYFVTLRVVKYVRCCRKRMRLPRHRNGRSNLPGQLSVPSVMGETEQRKPCHSVFTIKTSTNSPQWTSTSCMTG